MQFPLELILSMTITVMTENRSIEALISIHGMSFECKRSRTDCSIDAMPSHAQEFYIQTCLLLSLHSKYQLRYFLRQHRAMGAESDDARIFDDDDR